MAFQAEQYFNQICKQMRESINHPQVGDHLRRTLDGIADVGQLIIDIRAKHEKNGDLSPSGRKGKVAEFIQSDCLKRYAFQSLELRKAKADLQARRSKFVPEPIDRKDVTGEMRRREMREHLRALPMSDRLKSSSDPAFASAILDGPAALSGIPQQIHDTLRHQQIEQLHGPAMREVDEIQTQYEYVEAVDTQVRNLMHESSGMERNAFQAALQPYEESFDTRGY